MGIIATSPLRTKSRENPYSSGVPGSPRTPERCFLRSVRFRPFPSQAPTPGRLNRQKEPDPEKHEKQLFFSHFLSSVFRTPFPSRRFCQKVLKRWSRKEVNYIDFFDSN